MAAGTRDGSVALAICALSLLWATAADGAVAPSPKSQSVRVADGIVPRGSRKPQPKREPAPTVPDHFARPVEIPPTWKI